MENQTKYKVTGDFEIIHLEKVFTAANEEEAVKQMERYINCYYDHVDAFEIKVEPINN